MILTRLKVIRQSQALSMRALSERSGVTPTTIVRAERELDVYPATVRKLAKALGVTPAALRGESPTPSDGPPLPSGRPATAVRAPAEGLAHALAQAERCRADDDLAGAARWEQIAARIAAAVAESSS